MNSRSPDRASGILAALIVLIVVVGLIGTGTVSLSGLWQMFVTLPIDEGR